MSLKPEMVYYYAFGGIGDMLQCLESAIEAETIDIFSHYKAAPSIFERFNVKVNRFEHFDKFDFFIGSEPLKRHFYPKFDIPFCHLPKPTTKVVGIHVEGSSFSNEFWRGRNMPDKNMTPEFLDSLLALISKNFGVCIYIFCSPERRGEMSKFCQGKVADLVVVAFDDIWESLAAVQHCDFVIGMDSCIKTMANILKIPSLVFVGDYEDPYRDDNFINKYVQDGHMKVIKFKDLNGVSSLEILDNIRL